MSEIKRLYTLSQTKPRFHLCFHFLIAFQLVPSIVYRFLLLLLVVQSFVFHRYEMNLLENEPNIFDIYTDMYCMECIHSFIHTYAYKLIHMQTQFRESPNGYSQLQTQSHTNEKIVNHFTSPTMGDATCEQRTQTTETVAHVQYILTFYLIKNHVSS